MPLSAELPPFPSHEAFDALREQFDAAKIESTDRRLVEFCSMERRTWLSLAAVLNADPGLPAKKLTNQQRSQKRGLEAAGVTGDDIAALIAWFDLVIEKFSKLRHARAH